MLSTFADRALAFSIETLCPESLPGGVTCHPLNATQVELLRAFLLKFYSDNAPRALLIGINPGRLGGGQTGVPFTDAVALQRSCGIANELPQVREQTSTFMYQLIDRCGGPKAFYSRFYLGAAFPACLTLGGKNANYYDSPELLRALGPAVEASLRKQSDLCGRPRKAVVIGTGRNAAVIHKINDRLGLFDDITALEHPRFVLQYQRKNASEYIEKHYSALMRMLAEDDN